MRNGDRRPEPKGIDWYSEDGFTWGLTEVCSNIAQNRLYMSLVIAGGGAVLLTADAFRRHRREQLAA